METLFTYGTLQDPAVQMRLVGRVIPMTPDALTGYARHSIRLSWGEYPTLTPDPVGRVEGMVMTVTADELARFDEYETDAYRRVQVTLTSGQTAWVYVENP